jgi:hypothetical protein
MNMQDTIAFAVDNNPSAVLINLQQGGAVQGNVSPEEMKHVLITLWQNGSDVVNDYLVNVPYIKSAPNYTGGIDITNATGKVDWNNVISAAGNFIGNIFGGGGSTTLAQQQAAAAEAAAQQRQMMYLMFGGMALVVVVVLLVVFKKK